MMSFASFPGMVCHAQSEHKFEDRCTTYIYAALHHQDKTEPFCSEIFVLVPKMLQATCAGDPGGRCQVRANKWQHGVLPRLEVALDMAYAVRRSRSEAKHNVCMHDKSGTEIGEQPRVQA